MHASGCDLSLPSAWSLRVSFISTTAVDKCKYTCKCHSLTVRFPFPVFPDQACKMATNAVSSGRQPGDKCLPEYISTAMETKDVYKRRSWKGHTSAQPESKEGLGSSERAASCSKSNKSCGLKWVFVKTGC